MKLSDVKAEQVKELRNKLKMSYTEFASRVGVSYHTIWAIEMGKRPVSFLLGERIKDIAKLSKS